MTVSLALVTHEDVDIQLIDMTGGIIHTFYSGSLKPGEHLFNLEFNNVSPGLYLCKFIVGERVEVRKVIITN